MADVKRNIFANLAGNAWISVLSLVITPLQVNILGIEAYGLVGFVASLQNMFTVMDLGLSFTITRELASDHSDGRIHSVPLLRTTATIYWALAILIGVSMIASSGAIARVWFNPITMDIGLLEQGLNAVALYLALRLPIAMYRGILSGLERMDVLNAVKAATVSLRLLGGIGVLLVWRDLSAFLYWTSFAAIVEVLAHAVACHRTYPALDWRPGFSWPSIREVWGYSLSMNVLALLGMLILQLDRLVASKLLSLESFGYYSLAYTIASGITLVVMAISTAMMPSFASAHSLGTREVFLRRYDSASRVMLFVVGFAVFALAFFGEPVLAIWVSPSAAVGAWQPLALLAVGFWLYGATQNAQSIAAGSGMPGLPLKASVLSVVPYVVALYVMIGAFGANGAAAAMLGLNLAFVLTMVPLVHRKILHISPASWYVKTLLPFLLLGGISFGAPRIALWRWAADAGPVVTLGALGGATLLYGAFGYLLIGASIRNDIRALLGKILAIR